MTKDSLTVELPNFEGPLDLLLHLIESQKIDIYDIPIAQITSQYLAYLKQMQRLNLKIAGEYFVMSATLLRIKSQYLLPKNDFAPADEPDDDPREELVQQLVQYSLFKKISAYFKKRNEDSPVIMAKEASIDSSQKISPLPLGQVSEKALTQAFVQVLKNLKRRNPGQATIKIEGTPITQMLSYLRKKVKKQKKVSFFACAEKMNSLTDIIGLFLAMLELCKKKEISIQQKRDFGDLTLKEMKINGN